ncbi:MAG: DUF1294 domain-containing protein [Nitrososphaerota archaeon]
MDSTPQSGGESEKTEVEGKAKKLLENFTITVFTWIPRVFLIIFLLSFLFYLCYKMYSPELVPRVAVENVLYLIKKILEFLYSYVNITAIHIIALVVMCILISTVFNWKWVLGYIMIVFTVPIGLAYLSTLIGGFFTSTLQPVTSYTINDLLAFGFMKMFQLNYIFFKFVEEWIGQQLYIFLLLLVLMSSLGVLVIYVDKKMAKNSGKRIAEKDFVRYGLLGGGLGIILGVFLFKHKIKHLWLLSQIVLVTFSTLYILIGYILGL